VPLIDDEGYRLHCPIKCIDRSEDATCKAVQVSPCSYTTVDIDTFLSIFSGGVPEIRDQLDGEGM
jgi:hypothetical protein